MNILKTIAIDLIKSAIVGAFVADALIRLNEWLKKKNTSNKAVQSGVDSKDGNKLKRSYRQPINKLLTFPEEKLFCIELNKRSLINQEHCGFSRCTNQHDVNSSFRQLLQLLYSAEHSIDLCLYLFTSESLFRCIQELHTMHHIKVRLIIDERENEAARSKISQIRQLGIPTKSNPQSERVLMHNKMVIIDNYILLTGSMNWTFNAPILHHENILVTTEQDIVKQAISYYEKLWEKFGEHQMKD